MTISDKTKNIIKIVAPVLVIILVLILLFVSWILRDSCRMEPLANRRLTLRDEASLATRLGKDQAIESSFKENF